MKIQQPVHCPLGDCYQRVLAEDITAQMDFPPFDRSPLDGYALRAEDVEQAKTDSPVILTQVDNVPAGSLPSKKIESGEAARIMTGAKIPEGATAVIRLEDLEVVGERVRVFSPAAIPNICRQGEELRKGDIVLPKGTLLGEGALGLLAMLGYSQPLVYRKPKVAVLATGSELIGVEEMLTQGKIRNSNNYMLLAKIREAGGEPLLLGHVRDELEAIEEKLKGHKDVDVYITTGGASVGDYDLMEEFFQRMNIPQLFSRIAMKPGMPVMAGFWQDALFVALSGNPAAANVSFEALLRPVLRKMAGARRTERPRVQGRLKKAFAKPSAARRFVWAHCEWVDGVLQVEPAVFQGNGMLAGMLVANGLMDIPAESGCLPEGAEVEVRLLIE